ncbi:MAG: uroporphyrinogen-III synthase [Thermoanaerobaculia bacterium]|nr:uroporphyrinogen-III synthase [Thermoanaerobaculia bacterium]
MKAGSGSLAGRRVVVTRARHQAEGLQRAIRSRGGQPVLLPLLELTPAEDPGPLESALTHLPTFQVLAFTSANAVAAVEDRLPRRASGCLVAAVGRSTAERLEEAGVEGVETPDPRLSRAEGLLELLKTRFPDGARVFLPQAADARPVLARGLGKAGFEVTAVTAYDTRLPASARDEHQRLFGDEPYGWVTFTSPRIARHFRRLADDDWERRREGLLAASIGPITSEALRELGVEPAAEATTPGEEALVDAIGRAVSGRSIPG